MYRRTLRFWADKYPHMCVGAHNVHARGILKRAVAPSVVRVSDFFLSRIPNLKVGALISHAITSANLDFHRCI